MKTWIKLIKKAKQIDSFQFFKLDFNIVRQRMAMREIKKSKGMKTWIKLIIKAKQI